MRWVVDECISAKIVAALRSSGHDVIYAAEQFSSAKDVLLFDLAFQEHRLLLTEDKDFGELTFRRETSDAPGVIFLRISDKMAHLIWPRLQAAIDRFGDTLHEHYIVLEETRIRARLLSK